MFFKIVLFVCLNFVLSNGEKPDLSRGKIYHLLLIIHLLFSKNHHFNLKIYENFKIKFYCGASVNLSRGSSVVRTQTSVREIPGSILTIYVFSVRRILALHHANVLALCWC